MAKVMVVDDEEDIERFIATFRRLTGAPAA